MKNLAASQATAGRAAAPQEGARARHHAATMATPDDPEATRKKIYLHPGQIYASSERAVVTTILGSCVAVCLYDPLTQIAGVNHFLLPVSGAEEQRSTRFGDVAVPQLVSKVVELGAERKRLQAKLFGGANVIEAFRDRENHLGTQNVRIARELLANATIPIIGEDIGGRKGRKLVYFTDEGAAWIKEL